MDFETSDEQRAILDAVDALLARHAGAARAIALQPKAEFDEPLARSLAEAGFLDVASAEGTGTLDAALVVERVARAAGVVDAGASVLVAPALDVRADGPVALARADTPGPVRFAAHARTLLVQGEDEARVVHISPGRVAPVRSSFGFPMGRVDPTLLAEGEGLGPDSASRLARWWRVALTVEAVGLMGAALDVTVDYVKQRRQFGRAIGSFQAVQHRLARCAIAIEGSRWLAYEAAWHGAPAEASATAAAHALTAAGRVFQEAHQLSGAIGFTREHDLHVFSMRLQALRLELGGVASHRRAIAAARWSAGASA